jgi:glutamyl-tRNA synthetase
MKTPEPVRVRFAPSPTGRFHIGGARTALYDYLLARQLGGQFILRIEDTDLKRFDPTAEPEIMESLRWLGMEWDEGPDIGGPRGPYRQSERKQIYAEHAEKLVTDQFAYRCFCTPDRLSLMRQEQQRLKRPPRYDGLCRALEPEEAERRARNGEPHVIRFKTPRSGTTTAVDLIRGPISVENGEIDDYILLKSNGLPVYHLAAMVDDHLMGITHVLRSAEWLPTLPLHVLIYQAFGWEQPVWVHLSLFLNPSGKGKMSKRFAMDAKGGAFSVYPLDLRQMGYVPEAVVNWIALMGWSMDDHTEVFDMEELVQGFSLEKLTPSAAAVNYSKLDHFNGLHIRALAADDLARRLLPLFQAEEPTATLEALQPIVPLIQDRIHTLDEAVELAGFFFQSTVSPSPDELPGKDMTPSQAAAALRQSAAVLRQLPVFEPEPIEQMLRTLATDLGLKPGQLFGSIRIAVTAQRVSPPLVETMVILGRAEVLRRIENAVDLLPA